MHNSYIATFNAPGYICMVAFEVSSHDAMTRSNCPLYYGFSIWCGPYTNVYTIFLAIKVDLL